MVVRSWISLFTFAGTILFSTVLHGQYRVKTFDISTTVTSLKSTDFGFLEYGTSSGEIGLYDGIVLDRKEKFNSKIVDIRTLNGLSQVLTSKGLFTIKSNSHLLQSPNNLHIIDISADQNILVTTAGIFEKSGNDYTPSRAEFYNINEIKKGGFFYIDKIEYLWIDRNVFVKDRSWRAFVRHPRSDICITSQNKRLIISDDKGIVSFDNRGTVDTLYQTDSIGLTKIFALNGTELLYCAENQLSIFNTRNQELTDIRELNTELVNAVTVDKWENIWVAAGSYLYQIINTKSNKTLEPPAIRISFVQVNGKSQPIDQTVVFDKGSNDLDISFEGIHLSRPQGLMYQTNLSKSNTSPADQNVNSWTEPTKKRGAEYRNLEAGKYRFRVRATIDNKYHTYAKTVDIRVNDNTVQYYWLAGLIGALGILLTGVFFNTRYSRLKEKSDQERKLLLQENKMLNLQQKALQLQMNPHFVFNALNSIQGLIAKEDNKKARRYLQQFSSMMRSVLNQSREEKISLDDEVAYLNSYLSLEQMANNDSFDFHIITNPNVEDGINIPTMIVQPFIENAIIHGVKGLKERRGKIAVLFDQDGGILKCTISDNGIGRKAAVKNKMSTHKSVAIDVVNERLKGKGIKGNPVEYFDKLDEQSNPIGTEVVITMPID